MSLLPVTRRRDVVAAGQQQSIHAVESLGHSRGVADHADVAVGVLDGVLVVLDLAALGDGDERHWVTSAPARRSP